MVEVGLLDPDERIELIGGELVPMSPKGAQHEVLKNMLLAAIIRQISADWITAIETTYRLSANTYLEPDIVIFPRNVGFSGLRGYGAELVIEIADTSFSFDRGRKAALYATFGIKELWVIDARTRLTFVHTEPSQNGYRNVVKRPEEDLLEATFVPGLALSLSNLDRPE